MQIREERGLRRVINLCGVPSAFGAGSACDEAIAAAARLLPLAVDMIDLQRLASSAIAKATGAEAGCVTGCAAAGISVSIAATLTGTDLIKVRRLPQPKRRRKWVLVQREHEASCGAPLRQMVEITGAKLVRIGEAGFCREEELAAALTPDVCAALFVLSVGDPTARSLELTHFVKICHAAGVPVIVDGAAELDLAAPLAAGADLAIYSAQKALGGLTAGIIAGRRDLVAACHLQERGIGRPMKAGKEAVIAAITALERWAAMDMQSLGGEWSRRLRMLEARLLSLRGLTVAQEDDPYRRSFQRLRIDVEPARAGINAWQLAAALRVGNPAVVVWPYDVEKGAIYLDIRCATDDDLLTASTMISKIIELSPASTQVVAPPLVGHDVIDQEYLIWPDRPHQDADVMWGLVAPRRNPSSKGALS